MLLVTGHVTCFLTHTDYTQALDYLPSCALPNSKLPCPALPWMTDYQHTRPTSRVLDRQKSIVRASEDGYFVLRKPSKVPRRLFLARQIPESQIVRRPKPVRPSTDLRSALPASCDSFSDAEESHSSKFFFALYGNDTIPAHTPFITLNLALQTHGEKKNGRIVQQHICDDCI